MVTIKLLVEGGNMTPGPAIAQQLGPMGINIGKVISDINAATSNFKGITVPVNLDVDAKTKAFTLKVLTPPTSELLKKELGIEKGSPARMKTKIGNLAIEQVINVSKSKHISMLSNEFLATVKSVIGTCLTIGTLIENKDPKEILIEIKAGKYASEIKSQKSVVSAEKKKELADFFGTVIAEQEAKIKAELAEAEAAKLAAEAAAAAAGTTATAAVPGATPVAGAEAKPAAGADAKTQPAKAAESLPKKEAKKK